MDAPAIEKPAYLIKFQQAGWCVRKSNNRRINGNTLELIMRDVLYGVRDYICDVAQDSQPCQLDILSVEKESIHERQSAQIIPFRKSRTK